MPWLAALPVVIDVLRAALRLVGEIQDTEARSEAKDELRGVLDDFPKHRDPATLRANIEQFVSANGGARR